MTSSKKLKLSNFLKVGIFHKYLFKKFAFKHISWIVKNPNLYVHLIPFWIPTFCNKLVVAFKTTIYYEKTIPTQCLLQNYWAMGLHLIISHVWDLYRCWCYITTFFLKIWQLLSCRKAATVFKGRFFYCLKLHSENRFLRWVFKAFMDVVKWFMVSHTRSVILLVPSSKSSRAY